MSTLKIYNNKEKKKVLNYLMRFFMFIFLWASFRPWNCENELKNISNLGIKRSLAENKNVMIQEEESIYNVPVEVIENHEKIKHEEGIFKRYKKDLELVILTITLFLSVLAFFFSLTYIIKSNIDVFLPIFELSNISILIISILLMFKEIKIKRKNKLR
ncbi:fam-h protein [Plasmodium relictum]|uniref:Fam-h protein n=1 Tax=Plasmodium relictum TaxID=85471 RepID=A0A1J1GKK1_PLARL|nr:fam-h protein [Plasmodium relictum]CRG85291.1 fam-h protein [Plasmodium relictum]